MLTQFELLTSSGTSGNDEDSGMSLSPLDGLSEYPIEQTEFEYFESNLASDSYYDISPAQDIQDSLPPPPCLTPTTITASSYGASLYDTTLTSRSDMLHRHSDMKSFHEDLKPLTEALESPHDLSSNLYNGNVKLAIDRLKFEDDTSTHVKFENDSSTFVKFEEDTSAYVKFEDDTSTYVKFEDDISTCVKLEGDTSTYVKFEDDISTCVKFEDDTSTCMKFEDDTSTCVKFEDDTSPYDAFSSDVYDSGITTADFNLGSLYDTFDANLHASDIKVTRTTWDEGACKGKIGPLQRRALDSIFNVTEKPSRGLVLHIASELGLHHLTVKNFFSNGRRRLRRAAARLNDPERTRRENERRKEKRRMQARASATLSNGESKSGSNLCSVSSTNSSSTPAVVESPPPKETTFISLERRALMEKLADKVQRSKAQRSLTNDLEMLQTSTTSQDFLIHTTQDLLIHPANDILSQASQDILSHSSHGLLGDLPHDFLAEPSHDISQSSSSSSLLNPSTDPWNFF